MNEKIKVVIVDDNEIFSFSLESLLNAGFDNLDIVGKAYSVKNAIDVIRNVQPDLIFLDIDLPDGSGFDVLTELRDYKFEVVFTTSHQSFAYKSYEYSALYYLLKEEICHATLLKAIELYKKPRRRDDNNITKNDLKNNVSNKLEKIIVHTIEGQHILNIQDILYCESKENYCTFYLENSSVLSSKNMSCYIETLQSNCFVQIQRKFIVNVKHIKLISANRKELTLTNGNEFEISRFFSEPFFEKLKESNIFC